MKSNNQMQNDTIKNKEKWNKNKEIKEKDRM